MVPEFTQIPWLGEEFGDAQEMKRELKANCNCCFCCCWSKREHPGLGAVSPRKVQRACDEDEAIIFILPVRQSAPQVAFEEEGGREPQGSVGG